MWFYLNYFVFRKLNVVIRIISKITKDFYELLGEVKIAGT